MRKRFIQSIYFKLWAPHCRRSFEVLGSIQRRTAGLGKGLESPAEGTGGVQPGKENAWPIWLLSTAAWQEAGAGWDQSPLPGNSNRRRENGLKLHLGRFRLNTGENLHWKRGSATEGAAQGSGGAAIPGDVQRKSSLGTQCCGLLYQINLWQHSAKGWTWWPWRPSPALMTL